MFVVLAGNVVDGMTIHGPFTSHEAATAFCGGSRGDWCVTELVPALNYVDGALSRRLTDTADMLDEVVCLLKEPLIGPSDETKELVGRLLEEERSLRAMAGEGSRT